MASSGTFANNNTLIRPVGGTLSIGEANRAVSSTSGSWGVPTTLAATSGKWYIEYYVNSGSSGRNVMALPTNSAKYNQGNYNFGVAGDYHIQLNSNGSIYNNSDSTATQSGLTALQTGDVMAMALNLDASPKTLQFYRNGTAIGTAENFNTSATGHFAFMIKGHNQSTMTINAGQDSTFGGELSAGGNADDNGFGDFKYSPPSGFLALCTGNLSVSSDIDPAQTDDDIPTKLFGAEKWTGNGGTQTIQLGDGFQPDCVWTKNLGTANSWVALDSSRGFNKTLKLETADGEGTNSYVGYGIESDFFASTGIKANGGGSPGFNNNTHNYIVYGWRANGGTTSTNTDGTTTSTVQANQAGGFSIITYTGTGTNRTIGHGLSSAPEFMVIKDRDGTNNWVVYSKDLGAAKRANLNNNIAWGSSSSSFQSTDPSSTVITLGTSNGVNQSTRNFVCYAWHSVEGFSKFGTFEGNSNADGPYIYTGFRPRFVVCKGADATENWQLRDTARNANTGTVNRLYFNSNAAEGTASTASPIDILSNGFKIRGSNSEINTNTIFYAAWGDVPFKYNNAVPTTF